MSDTTTHGFRPISTTALPEYRSEGHLFVHEATGCEVYHVHNDDPENLFAFIFKTPPADSTGVAHIVEHTVLCGSERYPLKDPFLVLMRGSMNTFLNAMTFPDKTVYPASSPVEADLFNIMKVYGDAVFFPLMKPEMFAQEGHRLQFDEEGNLERTGIVYNEMKGNYSSHDSIAGEWSMRSLLPDTPYGYDSGGDPAEIPNLSYEQFRDFHHRYYHPSNARIFLYGNIDSERYLSFIEDEFLSAFSGAAAPRGGATAGAARRPGAADANAGAAQGPGAADANAGAAQGPGAADREAAAAGGSASPAPEVTIPFQRRWSEPVRLTRTYPVDAEDEESRSSVTLNWLLPPVTDSFQTLAIEVLTEVLLGHSGSPLYRVISESPLGEDLSAPTGIETELLEMGFSVGMRGTDADRADEIEELILGELRRLTRDGIDPGLVTAALRAVEFRNREIKGGPFGLRLMRKALRGWLHGEIPEQTLEFTRWFEDLRRAVDTEPRFFEKLIEEHLLENPHRSTLIVVPDEDEARRRREAEEAELAREAERMGEAERQAVREAQQRLLALQSEPDAPEDIAKVPFLTVDDLPREVEVIPAEHTEANEGVPMLLHRLFTNGVAYVDLAFDLNAVPDHLQDYLMLYTAAATECGLTDMSYEDLARELATHTGGLTLQLDVGARADEESDLRRYLYVRMKALPRSLPEAFALLEGVLLRPRFADEERLGNVVRELRNDFRSSVLPTGHSYVGLRSARALSETARIEERWKGLSQLLFLERLAEEDTGTVAARLEELRSALAGRASMTLSVTAEDEESEQVTADTRSFVARIRRAGGSGATAAPGAAAAPGDAAGAGATAGSGATAVSGVPEAAGNAGDAGEVPRWESILVSAGVNYVGASIEAAHLSEPGHVPEAVLAHLLRTGFLWEEIRMKGGAYGAMAGTRALERVFSFASYRDPNIAETLERFGRGLRQAADEGIDRASLELAIISGVGRDSRPLSPGQKSIVSLKRSLYGISDDLRQWKRDELLAVSEDAVREAARRLAARFEEVHASVMGSRAAVEEAATEYPGILDHTLELHL